MDDDQKMMLTDATEKLASIQSKIETINERLESGRLYSISDCGSESISVFERTRSLFRLAMEKQTFYAHFVKLLALFCVAVAHLIYMQSFLDAYSSIEEYSIRLESRYLSSSNESLDDDRRMELEGMLSQMNILSAYKKNTWMCVATMCVALCTSSFFLFILPMTEVCKRRELAMGIVDLAAFAGIPFLLSMRIFIVQQLHEHLSAAMFGAHRLLSAERIMNLLQCTIHPREKLPFCSDVILNTIFPIVLLKYLIILTVITLLYIGVAYLIEYCIRHWFPHRRANDGLRSSHCFCSADPKSSSLSSIRPIRHYQNHSYVPVLHPAPPKTPVVTAEVSVSSLPL